LQGDVVSSGRRWSAFLPEGGAGDKLIIMVNLRLLIVLGLCGAWQEDALRAQTVVSQGTLKWITNSSGALINSDHGLTSVLAIHSGMIKPTEPLKPLPEVPEITGEKSYASDRTFTLLGLDERKKMTNR